MEPRLSLFREKAIQEYKQRREKDILPHFITPSILIFLYLLLLLLLFLLIGLLFWLRAFSIFALTSTVMSTPHLSAGDLIHAQVQVGSS